MRLSALTLDRSPPAAPPQLFCLYLFSTLYHSLFALGDRIVSLFQIFDHSAIYLLIAGTYTPFLTILFPDKPVFGVYLVEFLWLMALGGICLNLCYHGRYKAHWITSPGLGGQLCG